MTSSRFAGYTPMGKSPCALKAGIGMISPHEPALVKEQFQPAIQQFLLNLRRAVTSFAILSGSGFVVLPSLVKVQPLLEKTRHSLPRLLIHSMVPEP
jgi:hypothetical protein